MNVSAWPFTSLQNSLAVVLETAGQGSGGGCGGISENGVVSSGDVDHVQWTTITQNGVSLYLVNGNYYYILFDLVDMGSFQMQQ